MKKVLLKPLGLFFCGFSFCANTYVHAEDTTRTAEYVSPETRRAVDAYLAQERPSESARAAGEQGNGDQAIVDAYVAQTRDMTQGEYTIARISDRNGRAAYRITVGESGLYKAGGERAFDVVVDGQLGIVTEEDHVR